MGFSFFSSDVLSSNAQSFIANMCTNVILHFAAKLCFEATANLKDGSYGKRKSL